MQVQAISFIRLQDPLLIKPVLRPLRIAAEPQPAPLHRAPRARLLHKRPRHQNDFIEKHARQRHTLNERRRALVLAAEKIKLVFLPPEPHRQHLRRPAVHNRHPEFPQPRQKLLHHVPPHTASRLPAQREPPSRKAAHRPQKEPQPHRKRLSRPHRPIADQCVKPLVLALRHPPRHRPQLLIRKATRHRPAPFPAPAPAKTAPRHRFRRLPAPPAAPKPSSGRGA